MPREKQKKKAIPKPAVSKGGAGGFSVAFFGLGVLVVVGVAMGYFFLSKPHLPNVLTSSQISRLVGTSSIVIPDMDTTVYLQNGNGTFTIDDATGAVNVSEPYFSVKTGESYDVYSVIVVNTGGSGEFVSIAQFKVIDGKAEYVNSYPIGDRVKVTEIKGPVVSKDGNYELTINYLDRPADAPMSDAPTIQKTLEVIITDHKLNN